jgi:hypothetical protein
MKRIPDGGEPGAEFILPARDVVHPENWDDWKAKGFRWYKNVPLPEGETTLTASGEPSLPYIETMAGKDKVVTGDPFDSETGRPMRQEGALGIYWRPSEKK